jgi:ribose transport system permease protein
MSDTVSIGGDGTVALRRGSRALRLASGAQQIGLAIANIVMLVVFSLIASDFFTGTNFDATGAAVAYTGIMSATATVVLVSGGLDLSVGGVLALAGQVLVWALAQGFPAVPAILLTVAAGVGCGLLNSAAAVGLGINPLIVTIGTAFLFRGFAGYWTNGTPTVVTNQTVLDVGTLNWLGIPVAVYLMLATFVAVWITLRFTRFGSDLYATGGNPLAARLAGLRIGRVQAAAYVISGASAAFAAVVLIGFQGASIPVSASATTSEGVELTVLGAVLLGGTGLLGGYGSVVGTLLGVILLSMLSSGLSLLGVEAFWQEISKGVALLLAVVIDDFRRRRQEVRG